jgi:hypothetical protein
MIHIPKPALLREKEKENKSKAQESQTVNQNDKHPKSKTISHLLMYSHVSKVSRTP